MPPKKLKFKPRTSKKRFSKAIIANKVRQSKSMQIVSKGQGIARLFPQRTFVPLVWTNSVGISSGVSQSNFGVATQMYLNSLKPLASSPVNWVQGYDQIAGIYNAYKVFGVKIEVEVSNPINTTTFTNGADGAYIGVRVLDAGGTNGLYGEKYSTARMKKWTVVKPLNDSGSQVMRYSRYFPIGAIEGLTKLQFNADNMLYNSAIASNPTNKPFMEVAVSNSRNTDNYSVVVSTKLTLYTQLYDRQILATSTI